MVIQSGNDASVALAEHVAGSESAFVSLMNAEAEHLGMQGTHYVNVTGWPNPEHYSTAADILILTKALIRNFPDEYALYSQKEFEFNEIKQSNRNRMLWIDKRVDGVKTGHTESAGYCLVVSAKQNDMRLISVVLGTDSKQARTEQSQSLMNYGFRFFETRELFIKDQEVAKARIWKGDHETLSLGIAQPMFVTYPKGQFKQLKVTLDRPARLMAPIDRGDTVGSVVVSLGGEPLHKTPLIALAAIDAGGFFSRMIDTVKLMLE
jgi:D-alanyl-D-alanine carboxypeptidase (penicillin-binding protein 5/6)